MTANKDTNSDEHQPNSGDDWQSFLESHSDDLGDIQDSRAARKFERNAQKQEKKKLLHVSDLTQDSFTSPQTGKGPRDFQNSWLDIDDNLDSDFEPGTPQVGSMRKGTVFFAVLVFVGVFGLILVLFVPFLKSFLATVSGVLVLVGGVGLVTRLRGYHETRNDFFDDGARV